MTAMSLLGEAEANASDRSDLRQLKHRTIAGEMTIGEMAREFGVTLRTLRFYEDRNLIRPRRLGSARYYGGPDRARLEMILKGKQLGFTLSEIAELIGAEDGVTKAEFEEKLRPAQIADQLDHLERQRLEIENAIARLKATRERQGCRSDAA
jgi:DNA-binding transcriptional MerR regulator